MAAKEEKLKKCIWYAIFIALVVVTVTQLMLLCDGWEERPFETVIENVPKQRIPYPSVTVCPAGSTIWSGVQQFLNEMEFKDEYRDMLKQSYNMLLRLKLVFLRVMPERENPYFQTYQDCENLNNYLMNSEACNFAMYVIEMTSRMISEDVLINRTLSKYQKNRLNVRYEEIEDVGCAGEGFACELSFNLQYPESMPDYSWLSSYLDLLTVEIVESGVSENPFDKVFKEIYLPSSVTSPDSSECTWCKYEQEIPTTSDNLVWEIIRNQNFTFSLPPPNNIESYVLSPNDSLWPLLSEKFKELLMLSKLQFQNFNNLGDFLVPLAKQYLYNDNNLGYLTHQLIENTEKELQDFFRLILQEITGEYELSWSLIDAVDILVILGGYQVIRNRVFEHQNIFAGQNSWLSLTKTEKQCVSVEYEKLFNNLPEFEDPCIDPSSMCKQFCKNMGLMQKHAKDEKIQKLLRYVSHPAKYSKNSTWTVPFCFTGNEQEKFTQLIKKPNVNTGSNETNYGYKFCESVEQSFTDVGLCTTFHDVHAIYPPNGMTKLFDNGIALILDSFADFSVTEELRTFRDNSIIVDRMTLNFPETLTDDNFNNFHIVLHSSNDVPLFQGPVDNKISLINGEDFNTNYLREYRVPFTVKITETEQFLEKYSITKRKCRFKHELGEMKLFQKYTKQNCIFECKLEMVRKKCNCLPWYLDLKKQTEPVCNLFGNKCYEQSTIQANRFLDFSNPYSPSCDCFPDCEGVSYIPISATKTLTALENRNILDLEPKNRFNSWEDEAMVIQQNQKKFLFEYVVDALKGDRSQIFYRSNMTADIDNLDSKRVCRESLINCLIRDRALNLASVWLDFQDNFFIKEKLIDRVPLGDRISAIGGTLGLFLGFSFLGLVDVIYWMVKPLGYWVIRKRN